MINLHIKLFLLAILGLISAVSARCSYFQRVVFCNDVSKAAFAGAFAVAVAVPAKGCRSMSRREWKKVGCSSPYKHRFTKVCAPAKWSAVLELFANAIALKTKILVRKPYTRAKLFYTSSGRALMRHELTHIRQQSGRSSYSFGLAYINEYCSNGCSYYNNKFEVEARKFQNDIC